MFLLVIVNDLNVEGVSALPAEADPILVVDTYAVLTLPVPLSFSSLFEGDISNHRGRLICST